MDYDVFLAGMKGEAITKQIPGITEILTKLDVASALPHS